MYRRQYQIVLGVMVLLDVGMILLSWNAAYWLRFHVVNIPPARMIVIPAERAAEFEALGVTAEEKTALEGVYEKFYSNMYELRNALRNRLAPERYENIRERLDALVVNRESIPPYQAYTRVNTFLTILTLLTFRLMGVYRGFPYRRMSTEMGSLLKGGLLMLLITMAASFVYREFQYSRVHMLYFGACTALLLAAERMVLHWALNFLRSHGFLLRSFILVGDSPLAVNFYEQWKSHPNEGLRLAGVVTPGAEPTEEVLREAKHLGSISDLDGILTRHPVQLVVSALMMNQHGYVDQLQKGLAAHFVDHKIVPDLYAGLAMGAEPEQFAGIPMVAVTRSPLEGWNLLLKRAVDLGGSAIALILFTPLLAAISILIRLTSAGPVFYSQERMGWNGQTFRMLKFRSMRTDAESDTGAVWASPDDSRSTWFGGMLRKTSLDELPQLINVLRGEMSLVGPRPERPVFIEEFRFKIPNYMLRHKIKAGITGWAQINGWRGNTSLEKRIEFDLYYISNWSIGFDFRILFLTLFKGFVHPNAY